MIYESKNTLIVLLSMMIILIGFGFYSCLPPGNPDPTPDPTPQLTPVPTPEPSKDPGSAWVVPATQTVANGASAVIEIHVNTGTQLLGAYGIVITYDTAILSISGSGAVTAMPTGMSLAAVNTNTAGTINVSAFDVSGKGPGIDLGVFQVTFGTVAAGTSEITVTVNTFADNAGQNIGTKLGIGGSVTVN